MEQNRTNHPSEPTTTTTTTSGSSPGIIDPDPGTNKAATAPGGTTTTAGGLHTTLLQPRADDANNNDDNNKPTTTVTTALMPTSSRVRQWALPPWHSVVALGLGWLWIWFSLDDTDDESSRNDDETVRAVLTRRLFPNALSLWGLALARGTMAIVIAATTFYFIACTSPETMYIPYLPESTLQKVPFTMGGLQRALPFTVLAWNLLGLAFATSATATAWVALYDNENDNDGKHMPAPWLVQTALVLWEIAAPYTLVVSSCVTYLLWPALRASTGTSQGLRSTPNLLMHNLNVIMALLETTLLGGLRVGWGDRAWGVAVGALYLMLTWALQRTWAPLHGPQFLYFFLDPTLPGWMPTYILIVLFVGLLVFYGLFVVLSQTIVPYLQEACGVAGNLLVLVVLSVSVCRVRD